MGIQTLVNSLQEFIKGRGTRLITILSGIPLNKVKIRAWNSWKLAVHHIKFPIKSVLCNLRFFAGAIKRRKYQRLGLSIDTFAIIEQRKSAISFESQVTNFLDSLTSASSFSH
jgi:hypothetical protein